MSRIRIMSTKEKEINTMQPVDGKVKCIMCRNIRFVEDTYRCFYCKEYFCEHCAKKHFKKRVAQQNVN